MSRKYCLAILDRLEEEKLLIELEFVYFRSPFQVKSRLDATNIEL